MKKLQSSQPLAVSTTFRPLNTSLSIVALGGMGLQQFYRQTRGEWMPDHTKSPVIGSDGVQSDGALRLKADYSIIDPDGMIDFNVFHPTVYWYIDGVQVTDIEDTADYYVADSILYVRKNFTHLKGASVYCECRFTDPRTGSPVAISASATLSAVLHADEQWSINLLCDRTRKHFPLSATTTIYSFEAEARRGSEDKTTAVKWFWDYSLDNGKTWLAINSNCYWYVDGKNSNVLRIDADFIENILLRVRIATVLGDSVTEPNLPNMATASLSWRWQKVIPQVFSYGGDRVFKETQSMTFGIFVHTAKRSDFTEAEKRKWLYCSWGIRKQGSTDAIQYVGCYDYEAEIKASSLFNTKGIRYIIDPGVCIRGTYDAIADSTGNLLADSAGNVMCVRC